ncbi:MAG: extracellular solute-binding protein [Kiritimatiellaeota bacterium]|nr:extracellular solute-binding protein [Kiritimatiellota bacterium]
MAFIRFLSTDLPGRFGRVWTACVFLAGTAVATAGWVEDAPGKTIIHVKLYWLPDPTRTDTATRADVAGVREFVRRFPKIFAARYRDKYKANPEKYGRHDWDHVEIRLHKSSGIRVEGVENDLLAIAGGVAPDVLYVNFRKSDTYITQGFLYPLDNPEDGYLTSMSQEEQDFRIHPKIWPVIRRKGPHGVKRVWAIPYGGALGKVLLYRKDLFEQAGLPYPTNDWTWDDLYTACRKITDPGNGVYGVRFGRGKHESWYWITFLWSAGGDILVEDEKTGKWRAVFDSPEAAVALDFYTRLCTEPWLDKDGQKRFGYAYKEASEASQKWDRGEIAMMFAYIDEKLFQTINPDVTGMVPVPKGPTGIRAAELNSRMMGLFSDIKDPVVRDAAWEYLRFYDCKDAVRIKTRIMVEGGLGRFVNPKYLNMFGYPEVARLAPRGWSETFNIAIRTGKPEPYGPNSNLAYNIMTYPIQDAEDMALSGDLPKYVPGRKVRYNEKRLSILKGLLHKAVLKANEEMLQEYTPRELFKRRVSAAVLLVAITITFALVFRYINRVFSGPDLPAGVRRPTFLDELRRFRWAFVLLLPALGTILVWRYFPLLQGSMMAFQDYRILGDSRWVWLDNFGHALYDPDWWGSVWNSLRYSFLVIALTFLPPVILAILLQEVPRGKVVYRTIFYLPAVITGLVIILLWKSFYEPSERGALNGILMHIPAAAYLAVGLVLFLIAVSFSRRLLYHRIYAVAMIFFLVGCALLYTCYCLAHPILARPGFSLFARLFTLRLDVPYRWLGDRETAMLACVLPMVWAGMGPGCLIYLAALKGIADDFYEAADIDGATFIDKILFIVFPILKPLLIINFVGVFINSWRSTANILAMTGGGAGTEVAGLHIFYKAFIFLKFGPATAMAWILGFMLIGFTVYQLRILSRLEFRTTGNKT